MKCPQCGSHMGADCNCPKCQAFMPTPAVIRLRAEAVQATWSKQTEELRRRDATAIETRQPGWMVPQAPDPR